MSAFYCQLDYEHVPSHAPEGALNGNLANNGCGICSLSMVVENLMGISFPPEKGAVLAKACGSRETYGTDLYIAAPYFAAAFGMKVRDTEDLEEARRFLSEKRGMVIANVRGDREGYQGIFSDSGHYVVIASMEGDTAKVWDPMYRIGSGRFDRPHRKDKVRTEGTDAYADLNVFREDCKERPYFLFEKAASPAPAPRIGIVVSAQDAPSPGLKAILQSGGIPILFTPDMLAEQNVLSQLDGLIISDEGGDEITQAIRLCREKALPVFAMGQGFDAFCAAFGLSPAVAGAASVTPCHATRLEPLLSAGCSMPVFDLPSLPDGMRPGAQDSEGRISALEWVRGELCMALSAKPAQLSDTGDLDGMLAVLVTLARRQKGN